MQSELCLRSPAPPEPSLPPLSASTEGWTPHFSAMLSESPDNTSHHGSAMEYLTSRGPPLWLSGPLLELSLGHIQKRCVWALEGPQANGFVCHLDFRECSNQGMDLEG